MSADGPIFIGGPDRCGKTLVAALLGSHSRIAIPIVGANMWTFFHGQFGDLADDRNLDRCIDAMLRYKHVAFLQPDVPRVRREARERARTYASLFALFLEHFAERAGKPRWGDQTGLIERYADEVFAAFPDARMIHLVRDPRDRYEASIRLWPNGRGRVGAAAARWTYSMRLAERNLSRFPDRYLLVRYEDVVRDPERAVRRLCAFVGEDFEPRMLEMGDAPTFVERLRDGRDTSLAGASLISQDFVGAYRGRIPAREIAFMEAVAGRLMRRRGYRPDRPRLAGADRVRYHLVDWPLNAVRMAGWLGLEQVQHRFPQVAGRNPIAAKVVG